MGKLRAISPLIILTGILAAGLAPAEDPPGKPGLTVSEAVALALERNPQTLRARAVIEGFQGRIKEVRSQALPALTLHGSGLRWRDPSLLNASGFDKIPLEFRAALTAEASNLFDYNLSVSQPLYTSGKVGTALKLAHLESQGVALDRDRAEQDVRLQVIRAFYSLLLTERRLDVARETLQQRQRHLEMARARFAGGVATEVDVLRSEVSVANAQPELIRAENAVRQARSLLNNLLVRPLDFPTEAVGELNMTAPPQSDRQEVLREAVTHRPELQRARIDESEAAGQQKLAQAESRFRLDFNGQYGFDSRLPANLFNNEFTRWIFSVTASLPLFDGGRRSGLVQQAIANRRVAELSRVDAENSVRLEAQTALDELQRAEKTVEAARLSVHEAERVVAMMQDNYRYGAATTLDVLDSETALTTARWTLLQGLYDHTLARAQLRYVMGLDPLEAVAGGPPSGN
jgi:outer membrane protein